MATLKQMALNIGEMSHELAGPCQYLGSSQLLDQHRLIHPGSRSGSASGSRFLGPDAGEAGSSRNAQQHDDSVLIADKGAGRNGKPDSKRFIRARQACASAAQQDTNGETPRPARATSRGAAGGGEQ